MDRRSDAAAEYRRWYGWKAWKIKRLAQLRAEPLCRYCEAMGVTSAATVVDHVIPHKGDPDLFWHGEVQSMCKTCHDAAKARQERMGYDIACDADGYPIDAGHPNGPHGQNIISGH